MKSGNKVANSTFIQKEVKCGHCTVPVTIPKTSGVVVSATCCNCASRSRDIADQARRDV